MLRHRSLLAGVLIVVLAAALSACRSPFVDSHDRVDRCVSMLNGRYPGKYTDKQGEKICTTWEAQEALNDDGSYSPPGA